MWSNSALINFVSNRSCLRLSLWRIWFGLLLCHINHCRIVNAKYIFIDINSSILNNLV